MAAHDDGKLTAIVIAYNSAGILPACLKSIQDAALPVIVVDNASADNTVALSEQNGARVVANPQNQGFGRAINLALAAADTEFCLILNPDIDFDPDAPRRLLDIALQNPRAVLVAPKLIEPDGRVFELESSPINAPIVRRQAGAATTQTLVSGAALLARREGILDLGGFDPNIFMYWEDNDICRRIVDSGLELLLADTVSMRHTRGASSAPAAGAIYMRRWHQAWSRFYVFKKFGVAADPDKWVARFSRKAMLAEMIGAKARAERYRGSLDGALAFYRGETALQRQGLS